MINDISNFISEWHERGDEKSDAQAFWLDILKALGVKQPSEFIKFEEPVDVDGHTCYIDGWITKTKVLIEQKSRGIDLDKPAKQSDGKLFTPFEQAKRYADALPYSQHPRWIITCNFDEFRIYDMDRLLSSIDEVRNSFKPQIIAFNHLALECERLNFIVDPNDENIEEVKISMDAVKIIEIIRHAFARKMLAPRRIKGNPVAHLTDEQRNVLNKFCVRLVFCLYAEDSALFNKNQFTDYIKHAADRPDAFKLLFKVLNQPKSQRDKNIGKELRAFPYVNGALFDDDALDLPPFDSALAHSIALEANDSKINWFAINPTIFGALFESNLSNDTRREGGMHYTSRDNIHKLIDPLFLEELHEEFKLISRKRKNRRQALEAFQNKIASLIFFDPACGSGNFLTETYISLRQLENKIIDALVDLHAPCTVKVSIDQFYGIEINGFACATAQTAMWISESKMLYDTDVGIREYIKYLPLKSTARIIQGNALELDWHEVVPDGADYIIGNPPFVGYSLQNARQKAELISATTFNNKKLDYVAGWFYKAAEFMVGSDTRAAFVSTNSICQGEQSFLVWNKLFETVHIDFAHRPFKWKSESEYPAAVRCVIVGFSVAPNDKPKIIFNGDQKIIAKNINAHLIDAPDYFIESRRAPMCDVPPMILGSIPRDGGNLIIEADDYDEFIRKEPRAKKFIRRLIGSEEFIKGKDRYCLWLVDATEEELQLPLTADRIERCRRFRQNSPRGATQKLASTPHLFAEIRQPTTNYLLVPSVSGERRKYVPMGFMSPDVIANNLVLFIADADLFHFGVLESIVHMAWMRTTAGYLGTSYRYSATIVYNNYPWCERTIEIEKTAQGILDARALYPDRTLASIYDPDTMPDDLRAAHEANDRAVLAAYSFNESMTEAEIVASLMDMYQRLTSGTSADNIVL